MSCSNCEAPCGLCSSPRGQGHLKSCLAWLASELTLAVGVVALIAAWVTNYYDTVFLSLDADHLFHDAIALLILSLIIDRKAKAIREKLWMNACDESCADADESCDECEHNEEAPSCSGSCDGQGSCGDNCACDQGGSCACENPEVQK